VTTADSLTTSNSLITDAALADASKPPALKPEGVVLFVGDKARLDELIATHRGNVVFVDYWATWCAPCVEGFPHTVELSKKYKDEGLATIAVSFDALDEEPAVREFLAAKGADFENLLSKYDGVNQEAAEDFDVEALPQYRLYDRQGELRYKWEADAPELEEPGALEAKIKELLAEEK
jgi:thiol-disulfide isomerase/thioredoxin